jgi:hypothetical protein
MYYLLLLLSVSSQDVVEEVLYAGLLNLVCVFADFRTVRSVEVINTRNTFVAHLMCILGSQPFV